MTGLAQELSTKDSISIFYDSLTYQLQTRYLYRDRIDWKTIEPIKEKATKSNSFGESLALCTELFDTINGSHLNIFSDEGWFKWSKGRVYKQDEFHIEFLHEYEKQPNFDVQLISNKYGYILMPAMLMLDISQDSINRETQRMYDQIMELVNSHTLEGWIIDLRFNSGGNVFPMLTALYHFLGDQTLYKCLSIEDEVASLVSLNRGVIHDSEDNMDRAKISLSAKPDLEIPIALITGILTASAGELIPISFSGRSNVTVIGEPTAGLTTANSLTLLPFGTKITLTSSYMSDRNAHYVPRITPDVIVEKQANFKDISKDLNIIEAITFFDRKR